MLEPDLQNDPQNAKHPLEPVMEASLMKNIDGHENTGKLLEHILVQGHDNNPVPTLETILVKNQDNTKEIVDAIKSIPEVKIPEVKIPKQEPFPSKMEVEITNKNGSELAAAFFSLLKGEPGPKGDSRTDAEVIALLKPYIPEIPKVINGKDGKDGKSITGPMGPKGKDGSPDSPSDIVNKLQSLKGNDRLDMSAIKGIKEMENSLTRLISAISTQTNKGDGTEWLMGGLHRVYTDSTLTGDGTPGNPLHSTGTGATTFTQLTDVPNSYSGQAGKAVRVNAGENALEFFTASGSGTVTNVASADGSITVTNPTTTVDLSVVSAPKLTTARTIWGQSFDGTANVSGTLALGVSDITMTGSIGTTGARVTKLWATDITVTNAISGSVTGNAGTATALQNARTIGGVSFDGTANITVASATGGFTVSGGNLTVSAINLVTDTVTGTKIGTATTQKIGFFNATPIVQPTGDVVTALQNLGLVASATITATTITSRTLWGQTYDGSANVTGSLTSVGDITGGASSMIIQAGTGVSRTLTFKTTTGASAAQTNLTLNADQSSTFSGTVALGSNSLTMTGSIAATGARVTKGWFTDLESTNMPTVGGTVILTSLTSPQFTTIELGHATDTTLARAGAGDVTIEGVAIDTISRTSTLTNKTITDGVNNVSTPTTTSLGYLGIPQNSKSAAYTTVMGDSGKHIFHPSADANARTFTIDSNANVAYPIGTTITFVNETSQVVSIAITTDTLTLANSTTTGTRSLAQNGVATALKVTSTKWIISGVGLT